MKHTIVLAIFAAMLAACQTARIAADVAQTAFEPYSVEASGQFGDSTGAAGGIHANAKFIAIDAGAQGTVTVRGPVIYGGPIEVLKTYHFEAATGRRAYAITFGAPPQKPVSLVVATWEQARASMPHLQP